MQSIILKAISLVNFKGIRNLKIRFNDSVCNISGDNATGKTTIMDAFTWCLFGKDSQGRADFEIKTLDDTGKAIPNLDHEVILVLQVNTERVTLKRVFREKWVKPRGQKETVFQGHETLYFYNDVPLAQKDYNAKIESICKEEIFKLLTNPHCFPGLNWTRQRQMLIEIAGQVSDNEIASVNPAYLALLTSLNGTKTLDEYRKEIASKKKRLKDLLEEIPARIDEVQRSQPEVLDWTGIEAQIKTLEAEIILLDQEIADTGKNIAGENSQRLELMRKLNLDKTEKERIESEAIRNNDNLKFGFERQIRLKANTIRDFEDTIGQNKTRIIGLEGTITSLKGQIEKLRADWRKINEEILEFKQDTICPTCGQQLPAEFLDAKKTEAEGKFNTAKVSRLQFNVSEGKKVASDIKEAEAKINTCNKIIEETIAKLNVEKNTPLAGPDYEGQKKTFLESKQFDELCEKINSQEKELEAMGPAVLADTSVQQSKKKEKQALLDGLKKDLAKRDYITSGNSRIENLKDDQQKYSQELADLEQAEYTIAGFNKAKIEAVESKINSMFRVARFKMFNQLINGGEEETCECIVDGVPYSDLNNAMKINAGIDILSVLSRTYGIIAPIFIDNRESVNNLLPVDSQLINLFVTKDKELVFN